MRYNGMISDVNVDRIDQGLPFRCIRLAQAARLDQNERGFAAKVCVVKTWVKRKSIGWLYLGGTTYLSNATCLIQPQLCYALLMVSRIIMMCYIIRHL